jgi:hypothetical protein
MARPWLEPPPRRKAREKHNRAYCAVCHRRRKLRELPVRDLRRLDCVGHRLILGKDRSWWFGP